MTFGKIIRHLRRQQGLSQTELSRLSGIPQTTISDLEKDKYCANIIQAKKLATALGVPVAVLLEESNTTRAPNPPVR